MPRIRTEVILQRMEALSRLEYLKEGPSPHFTVDQAREVIRIVFPKRTVNINTNSSSYGIKHLFERVSEVIGGQRKYCSNQTIKEAMKLEGFKILTDKSPNHWYNISEADYMAADRMRAIRAERILAQNRIPQ